MVLGFLIGLVCFVVFVSLWHKKARLQFEISTLKRNLTETESKVALLQNQLQTKVSTDSVLVHALAHLAAGIVVIDQNQQIVYVNAYVEKILSTFADYVYGKNYKEIFVFVDKNKNRDYSQIEKALVQNQQIHLNQELVTRRGNIWIRGICNPLKKKKNKQSGIVLSFRDATQEVEKEMEMQAFVSAAAHDLRTPLAIIKSGIALVLGQLEALDKKTIRETLVATSEAIGHLSELVNDFLQVSRIEQSRIEVKKDIFDLIPLVEGAIIQFMHLAKQKKLYLNYNLENRNLPKVIGDKTKTQEIISNLITNALKYTYQGGVTLHHEHDDGVLKTSVSDTGTGIDQDHIRLLFKKFHQVGEARKSDQSTGLGLFIAKNLAQLQGGDLKLVTSEPGQGSEFVFWLPIANL